MPLKIPLAIDDTYPVDTGAEVALPYDKNN
jgi:hypothetical protein